MTMPSSVRLVRTRFRRMPRQAPRAASSSSASQGVPAASRGRGASGSAGRTLPSVLSPTMRPSLISITRRACAATARSWVMRMMVWPASASSRSSAITSAPLCESSAPVGSSARMMWPPFMRARAIDTRCCCPPESWLGRLPRRSPSPRRASSAWARRTRSSLGRPA